MRIACMGAGMKAPRSPADRIEVRIPFMMPKSLVSALDAWRRMQPDLPSRSEAIRRLMRMSLRMDMGQ